MCIRDRALTPQGRQSVKKLMNHYGGKSAMTYVGAPKDFDRIAKEFHVDYAFHKVSPGHYLLFFKANQADAITAAFQKYSAKVLNKEQDVYKRQVPEGFKEYYHGPQDIPPEHRIFAYPEKAEPVHSILAALKQMCIRDR